MKRKGKAKQRKKRKERSRKKEEKEEKEIREKKEEKEKREAKKEFCVDQGSNSGPVRYESAIVTNRSKSGLVVENCLKKRYLLSRYYSSIQCGSYLPTPPCSEALPAVNLPTYPTGLSGLWPTLP